jgi:hypothetical protein
MSPQEELIRAGEAKQVVESQIFKDASEHVKEGIYAQMRRVPMSDEKMHTRLILALQVWGALEQYLDGIVQTGKLAAFQIEEEKRKRNLFQVLNR